MKILVTGSAGFLAYHLLQTLLSEGHFVVGIDNMVSGLEKNTSDLLKEYPKTFRFIKADIIEMTTQNISHKKEWSKYLSLDSTASSHMKKFERIYHLACPASPPIYQNDMLHTADTCYTGSRNIFELALIHEARILIASTSEIYGDPEVHPQPEEYRGNVNTVGPRSCYDEGKRLMETLGYIYHTQKGLDIRTARIFNTYGPRMNPFDGRVLTNFISQALRGENLTVFGDGTQTRSFCYVSDLIDGLNRLMDSNIIEPINLGAHNEISIIELAQKTIQLIDKKLKIKHKRLPIDDPKMRHPHTSRAEKLLGWNAQVSLDEGLKMMIQDFKKE